MKPSDVVALARHYSSNDRPVISGSGYWGNADEEITAIAQLALEQQVTLAKQEGQLDDRARTIVRLEAELGDAKAAALVYAQITEERRRQDQQWGGAAYDDKHDPCYWIAIVEEHSARAIKATSSNDGDEYRQQLVEIAALAIAAIESHDRKARK